MKELFILDIVGRDRYNTTMTLMEEFIAEIDGFLARSGMSERHLGVRAMGDPSFVPRLRSGVTPKATTIDRVRGFMRKCESRPRQRASPAVAA